ncbi:MAG TPA: hypothetical protein VLY03_10175 [Bacteroidota bacterium]|nr:hypothetical protein [Bacteroidota bacterium]
MTFSHVQHRYRFIRITAAIVVVLLFLGTAADSRATSSDPMSQFLVQLEAMVFGTPSSSPSSTSNATTDTTNTPGVDPGPNPPPPSN